MKEIIRYKADCGKVYAKKRDCLRHEEVCTHWTNPKHRTCKTCKYGENKWDSNGMEDEPQYLETWRQWQCSNPNFVEKRHFTAAHPNASDLCINCPVWELKERKQP